MLLPFFFFLITNQYKKIWEAINKLIIMKVRAIRKKISYKSSIEAKASNKRV